MLQQKPEMVIIGTGEKQQFPNSVIQQFFATNQLGVEIMDTGAACRTFNILLAENRQVAAILILSNSQENHHG